MAFGGVRRGVVAVAGDNGRGAAVAAGPQSRGATCGGRRAKQGEACARREKHTLENGAAAVARAPPTVRSHQVERGRLYIRRADSKTRARARGGGADAVEVPGLLTSIPHRPGPPRRTIRLRERDIKEQAQGGRREHDAARHLDERGAKRAGAGRESCATRKFWEEKAGMRARAHRARREG